jgi:hypothetical protein
MSHGRFHIHTSSSYNALSSFSLISSSTVSSIVGLRGGESASKSTTIPGICMRFVRGDDPAASDGDVMGLASSARTSSECRDASSWIESDAEDVAYTGWFSAPWTGTSLVDSGCNGGGGIELIEAFSWVVEYTGETATLSARGGGTRRLDI